MTKDPNKLRRTFNKEAELYNAIRPHYPTELFEQLVESVNLSAKARLLEIGPGTGQATKPLAEQGYEIIAVEMGAALADVARRELAQYLKVKVITGTFEDANLPSKTFDLVFSATAFHWIKQDVAFIKTSQLLKPAGHLAIIHTHHVSDQKGDLFFNATVPIYDRYFPPGDNKKPFLPPITEIKPTTLDEKLFKQIYFGVFPEVINYSAKEYAQLLNTFSPTLALPKTKRTAFLHEIETLINTKFNGQIQKHFGMSLTIAAKV